VKVMLNGEAFDLDFDINHVKMAFAVEVEKVAGRRYAQWESDLLGGGAEALAALACLIWRRDGRDVQLADVLSGEVPLEFSEAFSSVMAAFTAQIGGAAVEDPTRGAVSPAAPDGTDTTSSGT